MSTTKTKGRLRAPAETDQEPRGVEPVDIDTLRGGAKIYPAEQTEELVRQSVEEVTKETIDKLDIARITTAITAFHEVLSSDPNRSQWSADNGIEGVAYELRHVKNMLNSLYKATSAFVEALKPSEEEVPENPDGPENPDTPEPTPQQDPDDPDDESTL